MRGPDADTLARYFLYGVIVLILIAAVPFVLKIAKRRLNDDGIANEHELLTQFSAARDAGAMDPEEYEQVKAAMIRKARGDDEPHPIAAEARPAEPGPAAGAGPEGLRAGAEDGSRGPC